MSKEAPSICAGVFGKTLNSLGMRSLQLPVHRTAEQLIYDFTHAPQFADIDLVDATISRSNNLRVIIVGENAYYRTQCATYLATIYQKKYEQCQIEDEPYDRANPWSSMGDLDQESDLETEGPPLLLVPGQALKPPTVPMQKPLDLREFNAGAYCIQGDPEVKIDKRILEPLLTLTGEDAPQILISLTPDQMDAEYAKTLQFCHGFAVCNVKTPPITYLEDFFLACVEEIYEEPVETVNARQVVEYIQGLRGADFNEMDLSTCVLRTCELDKEAKELTTEDFCFVPKSLSKEKSGMEQLNQLMELENVKSALHRLLSMNKLERRRREAGLASPPRHRHMAFSGAPGTGKTVCAQLLARILREEGTGSGIFVEAGRQDMVGEFVGHTSPKIAQLFQKASGGVLFLDEIGALVGGGTVQSDTFAKEAIDALVYHMDRNPQTIVIFATYPDEMDEFFQSNPGLSSRVAQKIHFPSYSVETLEEMLQNLAKNQGYAMEDKAKPLCQAYFKQEQCQRQRTFGNGREVRRLFNAAEEELAQRIADQPASALTLTAQDFQIAIQRLATHKPVTRVIGF